jgi:hypothetical protein
VRPEDAMAVDSKMCEAWFARPRERPKGDALHGRAARAARRCKATEAEPSPRGLTATLRGAGRPAHAASGPPRQLLAGGASPCIGEPPVRPEDARQARRRGERGSRRLPRRDTTAVTIGEQNILA